MRKKRVINWMVILSILLTGCKQKKDTLQTLLPPLVKAEHIMYEYPDSALHILQEMQMQLHILKYCSVKIRKPGMPACRRSSPVDLTYVPDSVPDNIVLL